MVNLVEDSYRHEMEEFLSQVFKTGQANGSFKAHTKLGSPIYLEIVARAIQYEISDREMACFFCRDITT